MTPWSVTVVFSVAIANQLPRAQHKLKLYQATAHMQATDAKTG